MVSRVERVGDFPAALTEALTAWQSGLWTAMPGVLLSFDAAKMSAVVQVAIQARLRQNDEAGSISWVSISPLVDVPVVFPNGGGFLLTFPLAAGDEGLVIFSSRCIDSWWQSGGTDNPQMDLRLHDLSDGFFLPGARSQVNLPPGGVSTTGVELRSEDGNTKIRMSGGGISMTCPGAITLNSSSLTHNGVNVGATHRHGGVDTGSGISGVPE